MSADRTMDDTVSNQPNTQESQKSGSSGISNLPKDVLDTARKQQDEIHRLATTQAGSDETQPKWYLDKMKAEREKASEQKDPSQIKDKSAPKQDLAKESKLTQPNQPKEGQATPTKESQPKEKESQPKEKESQPKEIKEKESQPKEKESVPKEDPKETETLEKPLPKEQPKELAEVTGVRPPADTTQPQDTKDTIGQERRADPDSSSSDKGVIEKLKDKAAEWKDSVNDMIKKSAEQQVLPHRPPRVRAVQEAQEQPGLDLQDRHRLIRETEADMHKEPLDNASMERVHEHTKQEGLDIISRIKQGLGFQGGKEVEERGQEGEER